MTCVIKNLKVLGGTLEQTLRYEPVESYYCEQAFNEFKKYVWDITGNTEVTNSRRIPEMEALCDTLGLKKVYYIVMESYWNEQGRNSTITEQAKLYYEAHYRSLEVNEDLVKDQQTEDGDGNNT